MFQQYKGTFVAKGWRNFSRKSFRLWLSKSAYKSPPFRFCMHAPITHILIRFTMYMHNLLTLPFFHMHAQILIDTLTGLTSSLDSLLNTTSQAKLSECSPIQVKETDAHTDTQAPVSDQSPQKSTASEHVQIKSPVASHTGDQPIPLPDSSHQEQVKDDSAHTSDTTDHSDIKTERLHADSSPLTSIAHDTNVQTKSSCDQIFTLSNSSHQECSDQAIVTSGQTASIGVSTVSSTASDPHQVMLHCNDKLITALSIDPQGIAEVLLTKGLIPENTEAQVRQCSTPREKATILVTTIRQRIEVAPKRFQEFLDILSKQEWTKDILEIFKVMQWQS